MPTSNAPFALVVDDDPFALFVACEILQDAGFTPLEAHDVAETISILQQKAQSVLVYIAVEKPGSANGFYLARHVAARWPDIEIVVSSGRMASGQGDMPESGTFLGKPFTTAIVHDHPRRTLSQSRRPTPLASGQALGPRTAR